MNYEIVSHRNDFDMVNESGFGRNHSQSTSKQGFVAVWVNEEGF